MRVQFIRVSGNRKTGPIPVSLIEEKSCRADCPMRDVCYGKGGPLYWTWGKIQETGIPWGAYCAAVRELPRLQEWRHAVVGDLPHRSGIICRESLDALVRANRGKKGFGYTHHDMAIPENRDAIDDANRAGFVISLSTETLSGADSAAALGIAPVVVVLPSDSLTPVRTPAGRHVIVCPNSRNAKIQCNRCQICARPDRTVIVGFPAHGSKKRLASAIATGAAV